MKPILSPLLLKDFAITKNQFTFIPPDKEVDKLEDLFNSYSIELDFDYGENDHYIAVAIEVRVNLSGDSDNLPGYSFIVEGSSIFEFQNTPELSDEDKASLLNYSGLSITINQIRGFIATLTSYAPFGRYTLPAIDVNDLLSQKRAMSEED